MAKKKKKTVAIAKRIHIKRPGTTEDVIELISKMEKSIEDKLQSMRSFVPFVITIVTSLLAYLFTTSNDSFDDFIYMIVAYLLISLCSIFIAYFPHNNYKGNSDKPKWLYKIQKSAETYTDFHPWNLSSYIYLSDDDFIVQFETFANKKLSSIELTSTNFLKQKINEYRYKKRCISISYIVIIVGALIMALTFGYYFVCRI